MNDKQLEAFRTALVLEEMGKVEKFLAMKPDLEKPFPKTGDTPLYEVALRCDTTLALERLLAAGANPNGLSGEDGHTPLAIAAQEGHAKVAAVLIKAGADVNKIDPFGNSVLEQAAKGGNRNHLQIVEQLLAAGANPNPATEISPLMEAAEHGTVDMLRALCQAGADVNFLSPQFGNALFFAVKASRHDNVQFLLSAGADRKVKLPADAADWYNDEKFAGKTALEMATKLKKKKVIAAFDAVSPSKAAKGKAASAKAPPGKATSAKAAPAKAPPVAKTWQALDKWLKQHNPGMKKSLAKGAGDKALAKLEKVIGQKLPADFKASYAIYDGQKRAPDDGLIPPTDELDAEYKLLSLEECAAQWQMLKKLHAAGEFTDDGAPDAGVKADWWNPGWLPFASDGGGDSLCVDLAPAKGGKRGQIISCPHDDARRQLLAGSFAEWLADLAERIADSEDDDD